MWSAFDADAYQPCSLLEGALHGVEALGVSSAVRFALGDGACQDGFDGADDLHEISLAASANTEGPALVPALQCFSSALENLWCSCVPA